MQHFDSNLQSAMVKTKGNWQINLKLKESLKLLDEWDQNETLPKAQRTQGLSVRTKVTASKSRLKFSFRIATS